jgi:conjugative transposon TraK protein
MLKHLKNIDSAFKHIRLFSFVLILANLLLSAYVIDACLSTLKQEHQRIYVLANSKLLEAEGVNRKDNMEVELRDHIRMFHHDFFTLDPDGEVIQENITRALYLADGSARSQYDNLKESGYYAGVISGNMTQRVTTDSIFLNLDSQPYYFRYYGKLKITRPTTEVTRSLITEGYIRQISRSDHNPHGFLIERWKIFENKDLTVKQRGN